MRVIGGEYRSRTLKSVPGLTVRPTPDRLREALFNILAPRIEGAIFADLYAGTGAVGIEALSRGAGKVIFIEQNREAVRVLKDNLRTLGAAARGIIKNGHAAAAITGLTADIVFLDPPYEMSAEYDSVLRALGGNPPALVIVQHSKRLTLEDTYGQLRLKRELKQGDNVLTFYAVTGANNSTD